MKLIVRDPDRGYLDNNLWLPKRHCNVDGVKGALTFQLPDRNEGVRVLSLWRETTTHLVVPREFWDTTTFDFPIVDCRPVSYPQVALKSNIVLDTRRENGKVVPTGDVVQQESMNALLLSRGGILQLACVAGDTVLNLNRGGKGFKMTIEKAWKHLHGMKRTDRYAWDKSIPTKIRALVGNRIGLHDMETIVCSGYKKTMRLELEDGSRLTLTPEHEVLTPSGFIQAVQLRVGSEVIADGERKESIRKEKESYKRIAGFTHHPHARPQTRSVVIEEHRAVVEAELNNMSLDNFRKRCREGTIAGLTFIDPKEFHVHHKDGNVRNNALKNLEIKRGKDHRKLHQPGYAAFGYGIPTPVKVRGIWLNTKEEAVYDVVCAEPHRNFVANGIVVHNCGKGKTVVAIELIARRAVPAIIIVDTSQLVKQWRDALLTFLNVTEDDIGMIGDGEFDWKKPVVIATYTTLGQRAETFPEEARRWFGTVVWDEAHHVAAPTFARTADLFAGMRLGLTATPDRDDGMHVVYNHHIGKVLYKNLTQDLKPRIYFKWTGLALDPLCSATMAETKDSTGEYHVGKIAGFFGRWRSRLLMVLNEVKQAVAENRKILVLSNSVDEVVNLLAMWNGGNHLYSDIPMPTPADVGESIAPFPISVKKYKTLTKTLAMTRTQLKDQSLNPTKRQNLEKHVAVMHHTLESHRVWKKCEALRRKQQKDYLKNLLKQPSTGGLMIFKVSPEVRAKLLKEKQVTFAISKYGREGLDESSLDTVIVCEPMSSKNALQQLMGRAQRQKAGKQSPVVVFLEDDIGPMIGMCKKLRTHLREWPVEEGGPYEYELLGHPISTNRRQTWAQPPSVRASGS